MCDLLLRYSRQNTKQSIQMVSGSMLAAIGVMVPNKTRNKGRPINPEFVMLAPMVLGMSSIPERLKRKYEKSDETIIIISTLNV